MDDGERGGWEAAVRSAALAGDESAWRAWYDAEAGPLRRYVRWRCGGLDDLTDDVLQDVWLTAVRKVRDFDPTAGRLGAWLTGIAAGTIRNHLRKRRRADRLRRPLGDAAAPACDPAEAEDRGWRTARALAGLPPRYERALRAKYLDGLSTAAIAQQWGESPKAVESVLGRARDLFRAGYEHPERDD
jgi:RNA polymerase sigma-70 factor (ECF subfamily)